MADTYRARDLWRHTHNLYSEDPIFNAQKYSAERILNILLDPELSPSVVCTKRPTNVCKRATYIIDVTQL